MRYIEQFRYSAEPRSIAEGAKPNQPADLRREKLLTGEAFAHCYPIQRVEMYGPSGITAMYETTTKRAMSLSVGEQYDTILNQLNEPITNLYFDSKVLRNIANDTNAALVITLVYEK